jgi:hypothetical protein
MSEPSAKGTAAATRFFNVSAVSEQGRMLGFRSPNGAEPALGGAKNGAAASNGHAEVEVAPRRGLSALLPLLGKIAREERAEEREQRKQAVSAEAAKEAFFETPAGRARLAYKRGHRLFQYELGTSELPPTVIPGPVGSPARETTDPVDILNAVTVEGWKLVSGKFIHSELRGGAVGCYLFKRSQKRRLQMNDPWSAPR